MSLLNLKLVMNVSKFSSWEFWKVFYLVLAAGLKTLHPKFTLEQNETFLLMQFYLLFKNFLINVRTVYISGRI